MMAVFGTHRKRLLYVAAILLAPVVGLGLGAVGVLFLQPSPDLEKVVESFSLSKPRPIKLEVVQEASSPRSALLAFEAMVPARAAENLGMEMSLRIGQQAAFDLGTISIRTTPVEDGMHRVTFSKDVLDLIVNNRGLIRPDTFSNSYFDAKVVSDKPMPHGRLYVTRASLELKAQP